MDLVEKMLAIDKNNSRINMEGIKNHPWFTSAEIPSQEELKQEFDERT